MCAVLSVTPVDDKRFEIQLTLDDVLNVHADLVELLAAGPEQGEPMVADARRRQRRQAACAQTIRPGSGV